MEVVSNCCAVMRFVVCSRYQSRQTQDENRPKLTITKHQKLFPLACGNLGEQGKQIVRHACRIFTHDAARMTSAGIEVSQKRGVPLLRKLLVSMFPGICALCVDLICDCQLTGELGIAVRVSGAKGALFWYRDHIGKSSSISVDGG